jgi:dCTP diphosphatase
MYMSDLETSVQQLRQVVAEFVAERNWEKFHNLKNLSMSLAIEAAELMEHTQWLRTDQVELPGEIEMSQVAEELADVLSYVLAIANRLELDLTTILQDKMVKNRKKYPIDSPLTPLALPTRDHE